MKLSVGVEVSRLTLKRNDTSIYAETRKNKFFDLTQEEQLKKRILEYETDEWTPIVVIIYLLKKEKIILNLMG